MSWQCEEHPVSSRKLLVSKTKQNKQIKQNKEEDSDMP